MKERMIKHFLVLFISILPFCTINGMDEKKEYSNTVEYFTSTPIKKQNCFIVISKLETTLSVYEVVAKDTIKVACYPCCLSKNKGNKEKRGDMKTPESPQGQPFSIVNIQDAHTWTHDFGDGRGAILSYGNWFLRLKTPGHTGIGIHGSTNNETPMPGRASEGCIRLRDCDIIHLKEHYAFVGMPVIIKAEEQGLFPFENNAKISESKMPFTLESLKMVKPSSQPTKQIKEATKESAKIADSQDFYIVKSGDSLSGIASKNKTSVGKLIQLNNMTHPDKLEVGQRIRIR